MEKRFTSITDRLILYNVILGGAALAVIGGMLYYIVKDALMDRTFDQLISVRVVKKRQVENFFRDRVSEAAALANSPMINDFIENTLHADTLEGRVVEGLSVNYIAYLAEYVASNEYFSKLYLAGPDPGGPLFYADWNSIVIDRKQPIPVDIDSLRHRLKSTSPMIVEEKNKGTNNNIYIAAFTPGQKAILLLNVSYNSINSIMLGNNPENGLGLTGESYIVGSDYKMRSKSRFFGDSSYRTIVNTPGVKAALAGTKGTDIFEDYRGIPVLSSYSILDIPGLNWTVLAEIDLEEAEKPIDELRNNMIFGILLISIFVFIFTFIISKKITSPVVKLTEATKKIAKGEFTKELKIKTKDEIGILAESFNNMVDELKTKDEELASERLKRSSYVIDAQENERERLARELHDGLGQNFIALKLKLEMMGDLDIDKKDKVIEDVKDGLDITVEEIRRMSNNLMPAVLQEFGIKNALRDLCDDVASFSGIDIKFIAEGRPENMKKRPKIYIFRILQESLNNIIKHSDAKNVSVILKEQINQITMEITDDGKGFDLEKELKGKGNGLHNLMERAALINGKLYINTEIGAGTKILLTITNR